MSRIIQYFEVENKFEVTWKYECLPIPDVAIESIAYLLFSDGAGFWLGEVSLWNDLRQIKGKAFSHSWIFRFNRGRGFGSHATDLIDLCGRPLSDEELYQIGGHLRSGETQPEVNLGKSSLALDLSEGREAVANYYRVESRQVEIVITSN
jgi:hypothetical protein